MKNVGRNYRWIFLVLIVVVLVLLRYIPSNKNEEANFRDTSHLLFTMHARCRMDCRSINEKEIKKVIEKGKLNTGKSGLSKQGDETYVLEGYSDEGQHIRVVVTPENDGLLVITVIDLDKEWVCHCD